MPKTAPPYNTKSASGEAADSARLRCHSLGGPPVVQWGSRDIERKVQPMTDPFWQHYALMELARVLPGQPQAQHLPAPQPEPAPQAAHQPATEDADNPGRLRRGSVLCVVTESLLGGALAWLGNGFPDRGDGLVCSASMFDGVGAQIATLIPGGSWRGSAAQAYLVQNLAQSRHATLMADLDRLAADLVSSQADAVKTARGVLIAELSLVAVLFTVCVYYEMQGPAGQLWSFKIALAACGAALAVAAGYLVDVAETTWRNGCDLQMATQRLTDMLADLPRQAGAVSSSTEVTLPLAHSPSGSAIAEEAAPTPRTPDPRSALAGLAGSPEFSVPSVAAPGFPDFGAPYLPIPQLAGMPTVPDLSAIVASLPTMAQLSTALRQLNNLTGPTSAIGQLANTATQHAQMISTLAQQGAQQHATLADHLTTDQDTPDTDGTATGERAPIDAQTLPNQQQRERLG